MRDYGLVSRVLGPVAAMAVVLGLFAGCDAGTPQTDGVTGSPVVPTGSLDPSEPAAPSTPSASVPASDPAGPGSGNPLPPGASAAPGSELMLMGDVAPGVEANCLILRTAGETYLLLGGDRALLQSGGRFTVRGTLAEGVVSTCQQGRPFEVLEATKG
ncbi:MAG TPA: hypothetical protein VK453_04865 [Micromonosporaceae bacterium]|nr:hypothetical protein [Micromonosporaceae bacterium]